MSNTMAQFPPKLQTMTSVIREIMAAQFGVEPDNEELMEGLKQGADMYVLSNSGKNGGATVLVYPENLQKIANEVFGGRDLIVLPSSIHEAILVEPRGDMGPREVLAMVKDVNESQVPPEDVLADDAFYNKAATREVVRATDLIKEME